MKFEPFGNFQAIERKLQEKRYQKKLQTTHEEELKKEMLLSERLETTNLDKYLVVISLLLKVGVCIYTK